MSNSHENGQSISAWMKEQPHDRPPLDKPLRVDACVVGAGIAGLSVAYQLSRAGKQVVVLESGTIGGGQTGRTSAHLSNAVDDLYVEIERLHGQQAARMVAESHTAAIQRIESIVSIESIDCDFERVDGYLFLPRGESSDLLERERQAAHRAGLSDTQMVARAPIDAFDVGPALRFRGQAQFHPLRYLSGLADAVEKGDGRIFCHTHVKHVQGGSPCEVETTDGHKVTADSVIVATNTPINDMYAIHTKQAPYISYVIGASVPRGVVERALFWDTADPYHYVRVQAHGSEQGQELLIVGGEDHKTGQANDGLDRYARLTDWARERFPMMGPVEFRWSGQVMEPVDGVAFIGRNPSDDPHVYIATGDSGMGLTHGMIAGILITDLIMERENPWAELYDPRRRTLGSALEFAKENINVAAQYTAWVTGAEIASADDLAPGQGAIVRRGLHKLAVYRDAWGKLHERSAVCPHLGCLVAWNSAEHTWDCPCHGSRFDCEGAVINGPANIDLPPAESAAEDHAPPAIS